MSNLTFQDNAQRKGLYLPISKIRPGEQNVLIYLPETTARKLERQRIDELVRIELGKVGVTKESEVQGVLDRAEKDYEQRLKVDECKKEIKKLLKIRAEGGKIMQRGFRNWVEVSYRPVVPKVKEAV